LEFPAPVLASIMARRAICIVFVRYCMDK
jgi:hypothetical protein